MRSLTLFLVVMFWVSCTRLVLAQAAAPDGTAAIANEFLRVLVTTGPDDRGRFALDTTGGDPELAGSKNRPLISNGGKAWSSYTTVRLDNVDYLVGGESYNRAGMGLPTGNMLAGPVATGNRIDYREQIGEVEVRQQLAFVRGQDSHMSDTVSITYTLTDRGTIKHEVGVRILLDTRCGENDGAPLFAGMHTLSEPAVFSGPDVPNYWRAFDNLVDPGVVLEGTLRGADATPPDELLCADWGTLADNPWQPALNPTQGFIRKGGKERDSAVALLWQPVTLEPGKSMTCVTCCGLGYLTPKTGKIALTLTAPEETTYEYSDSLPFRLTGSLQNTGQFNASKVVMTLSVPAGLDVCDGSSPLSDAIRVLKPDEMLQDTWMLVPNGKAGGPQKLTLSATSGNMEGAQTAKAIVVLIPRQCAIFSPAKQRVSLGTDDAAPILTRVRLKVAQQFSAISFTVHFDPTIIAYRDLLGNIPSGTVEVEHQIAWTAEMKHAEQGVITFTGQCNADPQARTPFPTGAKMSLYTLTFRALKPGVATLSLSDVALVSTTGEQSAVDAATGEIEVVAGDTPAAKP